MIYSDFQKGSAEISQEKDLFKFKGIFKENDIKNLKAFCSRNHEGVIWSDDTAELFFSAPGAPYPYIHVAVNAKGIYRVHLNTAPGKSQELTEFNFKTAGSVEKDQWVIRGEIPVKLLAPVTKNGKVNFSFTRSRSNAGKRTAQLSTVQRAPDGGFHAPDSRFTVEFR